MSALEIIHDIVGRERSVRSVAHSLHMASIGLSPPEVGAVHLTCADEAEHEGVDAFQKGFVQYLLPDLKFAHKAPFRLANLGAMYDWGAVRIAENHYANDDERKSWKLLVVKVNAHVGVVEEDAGPRYGALTRYRTETACCGALAAFLSGVPRPFTPALEDAFLSEGTDRLAALRDEARVDPHLRPLAAALVSARLQARAAVLDIQDHTSVSPTLYLVVPSVTVNRATADTEIVVGCYVADRREGQHSDTYFGLGDDPADFRWSVEHRLLHVTDTTLGTVRTARDHRHLVRSAWQTHASRVRVPVHDARLDRIARDVAENRHKHHHHGRLLLKSLLALLGAVAPQPAAILLFAEGIAGVHHAFRVHRLARTLEGSDDARRVLEEIEAQVDRLPPDEAEAMLEMLLRHHVAAGEAPA